MTSHVLPFAHRPLAIALRPASLRVNRSLGLLLALPSLMLLPSPARADLDPDPASSGDAITMVNDGDTIDLNGFASNGADFLNITLMAGDEVYNAGSDALAIDTANNTLNVDGLLSGVTAVNFSNASGINTFTLGATASITGTGGTAILGSSGDEQLTIDVASTRNGAIDLGGAGDDQLTISGSGAFNDTLFNASNVALTLNAGTTRQLQAAETLGSLAGDGNVDNNGFAFTVGGNNDSTNFSGVMSGSGALVKEGSGSLTLTGSNTWSGGTTINAGDLQVGNSGTSGSLAGNVAIASGSNLGFLRSDNVSFGGVISGAGNVVQASLAGGRLTLSGNNTYSGDTLILAGILEASGGNAIGDVSAVNLAQGGTLLLSADETIGSLADVTWLPSALPRTVDTNGFVLTTNGNNSSTAFSGIVTGSGGITKTGTGTFTLSGTNDFSGALSVTSGTLLATGGSAIGDASAVSVSSGALLQLGASEIIGSLAGDGTVDLQAFSLSTGGNNGSTLFSGTLNGSGGLIKQGTGTFTLAGSNTYTGATSVNAGLLVLDGGSALADSATVTVASGATLALNDDETIAVLNGAGSVALGAETLSVGNTNASMTFDGVISGSGGINKTGTGTLTLTGNNTFTGATQVAAGGALFIGNGSSSGALSGALANDGAVLFNRSDAYTYGGSITGNGTVTQGGSGTLTLSGVSLHTGLTTVAAGTLNLTGVLVNSDVQVNSGARITGSGSANGLSMVPASVFAVNANAAGIANMLTISGDVTLSGGTVSVTANPVGSWSYSTLYKIIDSSGTLTGTFSNVVDDLAFLDPTLSYVNNDVFLRLTRNDVGFSVLGRNGNEEAVGAALTDAAGVTPATALQPIINTLTGLSTTDAQTALASLNGQSLANIGPLMLDMWETVRGWHADRRVAATLARSQSSKDFWSGGQLDSEWPRTWVHVANAQLDATGQPGAAGWSDDRQGFAAGLDYDIAENLSFGLSLSHLDDAVRYDAPGDSADLSGNWLTMSVAGNGDTLLWSTQVAVGWSTVETARNVVVGTNQAQPMGSTQSVGVHAYGEMAWPLRIASLGISPLLGLDASRVSVDIFDEKGGAPVGVTVIPGNVSGFNSHLGLRLRWPEQGGAFSVGAQAEWTHGFADSLPTSHLQFLASPGSAWEVYGTDFDRDAMRAGLRVSAQLPAKFELYLDADVQQRGDIEQQSMLLGVRKDW